MNTPNRWQKATKFRRFTWSWQRCVYTIGIEYFEQWDVRFDQSRDIAKPDIILKRLSLGLWWWEFSVWFAKRVTP